MDAKGKVKRENIDTHYVKFGVEGSVDWKELYLLCDGEGGGGDQDSSYVVSAELGR